jgi:hypothetical protein
MLASFGWSDLAYLALSIFLLAAGIAFVYAAIRLGGTLRRASSLLEGTETELLPVITKLGGTVDRVNVQLDKVDGPVGKLAGLAAGIRHGVSTLTTRRSFGDAVRTGKEEAARRERDLEEELDEDK